jgi:hypothetical protein
MHGHPLVVLDHRGNHRQVVTDTLGDNEIPGIDALLAEQLLQGGKTAATCSPPDIPSGSE